MFSEEFQSSAPAVAGAVDTGVPRVDSHDGRLLVAWKAWNSARTASSIATPTPTASDVTTRRRNASRPLLATSRNPSRYISGPATEGAAGQRTRRPGRTGRQPVRRR